MNNQITFTSSKYFHDFIMYAVVNGLAYKATEHDGVYTVVVTGY